MDWNRNIVESSEPTKVGWAANSKANHALTPSQGAKTGPERDTPVRYETLGDDLAIFASKSGADTNLTGFAT